MRLRQNFEGLRQTATLCLGIQLMTEYISGENMKFDTLTSWIRTVFLLARAEEKAVRGGLLHKPLVPQHDMS